MIFKNNKVYKILKWIGITALPALMVFYGVVAKTCNIPYTTEVLTIWGAFITLWNTLLGISSESYHSKEAK